MLYDCFTFFNELDLLEIRLNILNDSVDKFVIVEATRTQNNKEKCLYFEENKARFAKFEDKIIHVVVKEFPQKLEQWTIENYQRNEIMRGLVNCKDDDVIIISDLDEIPNPKYIKKYKNTKKIIGFQLNTFNYYLNNYSVGQRHEQRFPKMLSFKNLKNILDGTKVVDIYDHDINIGTTPTLVRIYKGNLQKTIRNAGWHFSYIGGAETVIKKFTSTCEGVNSFTREQYEKRSNQKIFNNQWFLIPVKIDNTFPKYIQKNKDKYFKLIKNEAHTRLNSVLFSYNLKTIEKELLIFVVRCFTCLVPSKKLRHQLNQKAKDFDFTMNKNKVVASKKLKQGLKEEIINQNQDSSAKILHVGTYNTECGIAEFTKNYITALGEVNCKYNKILPFKYDYLENEALFKMYLDKIVKLADNYDLISIQHEYSFWSLKKISTKKYFNNKFYKKYKVNNITYSLILLDYLVGNLLKKNKYVNIVWHNGFGCVLNLLINLKIINYNTHYSEIPFFRFFDSKLLHVIVMNEKIIEVLKNFDIPLFNIKILQHPVSKIDYIENKNINVIKEKYNLNSNDIVIGSFGFVNKLKGIDRIINALKFLPENYKYIHFGGVHPNDNSNYIFELENLINQNMLVSRVIISGFIKSSELNLCMRLINLGLYVGETNNNYASGAICNLLANKVPVLVSDIAQFSEIRSEYNCLEICKNPENAEILAENIFEIVNDKHKIEMLKKNIEKYLIDHSFTSFAQNTVDFLLPRISKININDEI